MSFPAPIGLTSDTGVSNITRVATNTLRCYLQSPTGNLSHTPPPSPRGQLTENLVEEHVERFVSSSRSSRTCRCNIWGEGARATTPSRLLLTSHPNLLFGDFCPFAFCAIVFKLHLKCLILLPPSRQQNLQKKTDAHKHFIQNQRNHFYL